MSHLLAPFGHCTAGRCSLESAPHSGRTGVAVYSGHRFVGVFFASCLNGACRASYPHARVPVDRRPSLASGDSGHSEVVRVICYVREARQKASSGRYSNSVVHLMPNHVIVTAPSHAAFIAVLRFYDVFLPLTDVLFRFNPLA